jgi:hypothetical protein
MTESMPTVFGQQSGGSGSGLDQTVNQVMGGDASAGSGTIAKSHLGGMSPAIQQQNAAYRAANERRAFMQTSGDRSNVVFYSNTEDLRISNLLEKSEYGSVLAEPSLNFQAPISQSCACVNDMCKSRYPSFLSVCPECGTDKHAGRVQRLPETGFATVQKSVLDSIRGPQTTERACPSGLRFTDE